MNYRKIEINSEDKSLESILPQIAKWHNMTPKLWRPEYRVTSKDMEETIERIKNTKKEDLFIMIAEDNNKIQGFIWACKQEKPQDSVMILSLYITEDYRERGIATKLKILLEEWCKRECIKIIQTTVHYDNQNMISLNQKMGYNPGMVRMTKTL
ncbi:GNAT family N-acetyltransferase [Sporosalibacterium faouarense]|uniref:GNAT family N-acetyltransferase n=1 Tax=Sporosalibacterium faouarense TaxID=516123 RepID=UPI00141C56C7|nr:GNAT family N-acetyltransferase [Sporosalibacterium faouarense]MTI47919.1 GNAT family N-acetyltransferase [Bacillota bacterium]